MFTIKVVNKDIEQPRNPETNSVALYTADREVRHYFHDVFQTPVVEFFSSTTGGYVTVDTGVVFVMNAAGKTVDTFRLKNSEWY